MSDENQSIDTSTTEDISAATSENDTIDASEADDSDESQDQSQNQQQLKKEKGNRRNERAEKQINRLTARAKTAETELAEIKAWKAEQERKSSSPAPAKPRPKADDFDTTDEYHEALWDWKDEQKEAARNKKANEEKAVTEKQKEQQSRKAAAKKFEEDFETKEAAFAAKNPDYHDLVEEFAETLPQTQSVAKTFRDIAARPDAAEILYALAKDPKLADEVFPERKSKIDSVAERIKKSQSSQQNNKSLPNPPSRVSANSGNTNTELSGRELLKKHKIYNK